VLLTSVWIGFVVNEKIDDERDAIHRMGAGRMSYLSGITVLMIALVVEGFGHRIDPWISIALGVMVIVKLGSRLYFDTYR
jgi:hypothetical protein